MWIVDDAAVARRAGRALATNGRLLCLAAALCCSLVIAGCGGGNHVPTVVATPTPAPVQMQVTSGSQALAAHHFVRIPFTTTRSGVLGVAVEWTFGSNTVWVDVAAGDCTVAQFQAGQCEFVVASNDSAPTPTKTLSIPAFAPGTHTLIIDNRGPADESLSYQVTLTY